MYLLGANGAPPLFSRRRRDPSSHGLERLLVTIEQRLQTHSAQFDCLGPGSCWARVVGEMHNEYLHTRRKSVMVEASVL